MARPSFSHEVASQARAGPAQSKVVTSSRPTPLRQLRQLAILLFCALLLFYILPHTRLQQPVAQQAGPLSPTTGRNSGEPRPPAATAEGEHAVPAAQAEGQQAVSAARAEGRHAIPAAQEEGQQAVSAARAEGQHAIPAAQAEGQQAVSGAQAEGQHAIPASQEEGGQHARGEGWQSYVAICAIVKNQQLDVKEWVAYHHMLGIENIYIVDPGSSPPLSDYLQGFIASGVVHYQWQVPEGLHWKPPATGPQTAVYDWCLRQFGHRHTWMAFFDADEFLVLRDPGVASLPALLREYEAGHIGALVVNWNTFGSGGLEARPRTNTLLAYTACLPPNHPTNALVKSIVRPAHTRETNGNPHSFLYHDGWYAVNTRRERIDYTRTDEAGVPVAHDRLALHHYFSKSLYDFMIKRARGAGDGSSKDYSMFEAVNIEANQTCTQAIGAGQQLARLLGHE